MSTRQCNNIFVIESHPTKYLSQMIHAWTYIKRDINYVNMIWYALFRLYCYFLYKCFIPLVAWGRRPSGGGSTLSCNIKVCIRRIQKREGFSFWWCIWQNIWAFYHKEVEHWWLTNLPGWKGISGPPVISTATTPANYSHQDTYINQASQVIIIRLGFIYSIRESS